MRFEPGSKQSCACGERHRRLLAARPDLTNRMSESFKYGSVGGAGRKPGPYPAANRHPLGFGGASW